MRNFFNKKRLRQFLFYIFLPVLLLIVAFGFSFKEYLSQDSFSVLIYEYSDKVFKEVSSKDLREGKLISGRFVSPEQNLGIISIRFNTHERINNNLLEFRIKRYNAKEWYYIHEYKTDQFQNGSFFTFGFPIINNSKGEKFLFTLSSRNTTESQFVSISDQNPVLLTKHDFSPRKKEIFYIGKKIINLFRNSSFRHSFFIYCTPLGMYLFFIFLSRYPSNRYIHFFKTKIDSYLKTRDKTKKKKNQIYLSTIIMSRKNLFFLFLSILIFLDIQGVVDLRSNFFVLVCVLSFFSIYSVYFNIPEEDFFIFSLALLIFSQLLLIFRMISHSEDLAIWIFIILLISLLIYLLKMITSKFY